MPATVNLLQSIQTEIETGVGLLPLSAYFQLKQNLLEADVFSVEDSDAGWFPLANSAIRQTSDQALEGTKSLEVITTIDGTSGAISKKVTVTQGQAYAAFANVRPRLNQRQVQLSLVWFDETEAEISASYGRALEESSTDWIRVHVSGIAPTGAVSASVRIQYLETSTYEGGMYIRGTGTVLVYGGKSVTGSSAIVTGSGDSAVYGRDFEQPVPTQTYDDAGYNYDSYTLKYDGYATYGTGVTYNEATRVYNQAGMHYNEGASASVVGMGNPYISAVGSVQVGVARSTQGLISVSSRGRVRVNTVDLISGESHFLDDIRMFEASWGMDYNCDLYLSTEQKMADAIRDNRASVKIVPHVNGDAGAGVHGGIFGAPVVGGNSYRLTAWFRTTAVVRTIRLEIHWYSANGSLLSISSGTGNEVPGDWALVSVVAYAPPGAFFATMYAYVLNAGADEAHYVSEIVFARYPQSIEKLEDNALWGIWRWFPEYIKHADGRQETIDRPFERYMHSVTSPVQEIIDLIERFYYIPPDDNGPSSGIHSTSDLVDPATADDQWLLWLSRLVGIRYTNITNNFFTSWTSLYETLGDTVSPLTWNEIAGADTNNNGTQWSEINQNSSASFDLTSFIRAQISSAITGMDAGSDDGLRRAIQSTLIGQKVVLLVRNYLGSPWNVLIKTHEDETPNLDNLMVMANAVKPAGAVFYHEFI